MQVPRTLAAILALSIVVGCASTLGRGVSKAPAEQSLSFRYDDMRPDDRRIASDSGDDPLARDLVEHFAASLERELGDVLRDRKITLRAVEVIVMQDPADHGPPDFKPLPSMFGPLGLLVAHSFHAARGAERVAVVLEADLDGSVFRSTASDGYSGGSGTRVRAVADEAIARSVEALRSLLASEPPA